MNIRWLFYADNELARLRRTSSGSNTAVSDTNWETGRAVRWRIRRSDGQPMGVASIWDHWTDPGTGEIVTSFSMLTLNADGHPVMGQFHRPGDEKHSVVVLEPQQFATWLHPRHEPVQALLHCPSQGLLVSEPAPTGRTAAAPAPAPAPAPAQQGLFG